LSSYGTNCALFSGIPRELIARAERYTEIQASGDDLVTLIRGETNQQELIELKVAEETAKRFVAWEIDPIDVRQNLSTILDSAN
jgi:DNA mismatch repair ATPase MutS